MMDKQVESASIPPFSHPTAENAASPSAGGSRPAIESVPHILERLGVAARELVNDSRKAGPGSVVAAACSGQWEAGRLSTGRGEGEKEEGRGRANEVLLSSHIARMAFWTHQ
jgi:hypothetical protein